MFPLKLLNVYQVFCLCNNFGRLVQGMHYNSNLKNTANIITTEIRKVSARDVKDGLVTEESYSAANATRQGIMKDLTGNRRQFSILPNQAIPVHGPLHHVHFVPKPYPVESIRFVPKPLPVAYPVPAQVHVSHLHLRPKYHLNPCQNGGIYVQLHQDYFCICPREYRGKNCEDRNYCASNPCKNGATCTEIPGAFKCKCPLGFLGAVCEEPNPCHPNPCKNGGMCTRSKLGEKFSCVCQEGFKGKQCDSINKCDPNPCKGGATCQQLGNDKFVCLCPPSLKGTLCTDAKQCYVNPCLHAGTCHEDGFGYNCTCRLGFTGNNCESHVCHPNPCFHGGHCRVFYGHSKCYCPPVFRGDRCEIPHPCSTHPCLNGGLCIDSYSGYNSYPWKWNQGFLHYLCLCQAGFTGSNCEVDICKKCDVNAKCLNDTCICVEGYYGDGFTCHKIPHPCHPNPCKNGAKCKEMEGGEYDCECPPGTSGKHCEEKDACVPNPCANNGKCMQSPDGGYRCTCENGYTGVNCDLVIDGCLGNPCQNGATCRFENGKVQCLCKGKFTGPTCSECGCPKGNPTADPPIFAQKCDAEGECYCESDMNQVKNGCLRLEDPNPCLSNPCQNGGTCVTIDINGGKAYLCECPEGFKGINCEQAVCTPGYCLNGGICKPVNKQPTCICQAGYTGPRCGKKPITPSDYCHPNPCLNGGSCVQVQGGYDCHCDIQFTGAHCEVDKCAKCDVHAICLRGRCKCISGYTGTGYECIKKAPRNRCPIICPIYSTCIHGACQCIPGYQMQGNSCTPPHKLVTQKAVPHPVPSPAVPPPPPPPPPPPSPGFPVVYNVPYGKRSYMGGEVKSSSKIHHPPA
ncbi:fibropellin-1-like isoform X2 [Montipora foliosa]|uniref:fibropellin-1-like isoform X2 n=1 Tax=Montipora foliosa TaxID=591990 RepID=UPI0035F1B1C7